jgi:hypothetical protein
MSELMERTYTVVDSCEGYSAVYRRMLRFYCYTSMCMLV